MLEWEFSLVLSLTGKDAEKRFLMYGFDKDFCRLRTTDDS